MPLHPPAYYQMSGLTLEDLSFFDSHGSTAKPVQSKGPSIPVPVASGDDDDFGEFVEVESRPKPTPKAPAAKPGPSIVSQLQELSSAPQVSAIRFGQTGTSSPNTQWTELLSATPGPQSIVDTRSSKPSASKPAQSSYHTSLVPTTRADPSTSITGVSSSTSPVPRHTDVFAPVTPLKSSRSAPTPPLPTSTPPQSTSLVDVDDWGADQDDDFDDFDDFTSASDVPPPAQLLAYFHTHVMPLANPLFADLVPLPYPIKRRVLARGETKSFLSGLVEAMAVSGRIMAGRSRTALDAAQLKQADREAREVVRAWKALSARIKTLVPDLSVPDLDDRFVVSAKRTASEYCAVCGLSKTDLVRGHTRPAWSSERRGHTTCLSWWDNKTTFGIP